MDDAIQVSNDGVSVTTGASSAVVAIPNCSNGTKPKYIRIAASAESYIRIGTSGAVATANSVLIQPADAVTMVVSGNTHVAYIQGQGPARVNIIPIDNQ